MAPHPIYQLAVSYLRDFDRYLGLPSGTLDNYDLLGLMEEEMADWYQKYDQSQFKEQILSTFTREKLRQKIVLFFRFEPLWCNQSIEGMMTFGQMAEQLNQYDDPLIKCANKF